jgi:hypothetical protein
MVRTLALVCVGTFGASLVAAFAADTLDAVALVLVALSGVATALAMAALSLVSRKPAEPLEHFVTICAWTRRVQCEGRWISFEEYLAKEFNVRCTHGICEEAAHRLREPAAKPAHVPQSSAM